MLLFTWVEGCPSHQGSTEQTGQAWLKLLYNQDLYIIINIIVMVCFNWSKFTGGYYLESHYLFHMHTYSPDFNSDFRIRWLTLVCIIRVTCSSQGDIESNTFKLNISMMIKKTVVPLPEFLPLFW